MEKGVVGMIVGGLRVVILATRRHADQKHEGDANGYPGPPLFPLQVTPGPFAVPLTGQPNCMSNM